MRGYLPNEDTLYSGEPPADLRTLDLTQDFDHVTGLLKAGKNSEVDAYVSKNWLGRNQQCYQPLGDLFLDFTGATGAATEFRRWLDLGTATTGVSFKRGGVTFTREIFASHPDQAIVIHLRADKPGALAFKASFASVHPSAKSHLTDDRLLLLRGQLPGYVGRRPMRRSNSGATSSAIRSSTTVTGNAGRTRSPTRATSATAPRSTARTSTTRACASPPC